MKEREIICYQYQVWIECFSRQLKDFIVISTTTYFNPNRKTNYLPFHMSNKAKKVVLVAGWRIKEKRIEELKK